MSGSIRAVGSIRLAHTPLTPASSIAPISPPAYNPLAPMRHNCRRLPIPQWEFGFTPATSNLTVETGLDGDRIARECTEADCAQRKAEMATDTTNNRKTANKMANKPSGNRRF